MQYLIDGHNLIGQTPGIRLDDPDDEGKIVLLVRQYLARTRGASALIVFDHGVYGHPGNLNGYKITCYFARSPSDADTHLIRRIKAAPRPEQWTLVTSDRHIVDAARARRMRVRDSRDFAAALLAPTSQAAPAEKPEPPRSAAEIAQWMRLFGEHPEEHS